MTARLTARRAVARQRVRPRRGRFSTSLRAPAARVLRVWIVYPGDVRHRRAAVARTLRR